MADEADVANEFQEQFIQAGLYEFQRQLGKDRSHLKCEECGEEPMKLKHDTTSRFCYDCARDLGLIG